MRRWRARGWARARAWWDGGGRRACERGSIAPLVPIVALGLLLLGGLVIDASRQLNGRSRALAYAEEAARAGAQAVDVTRPGLTLLEDGSPKSVQARVTDYCTRAMAGGGVRECQFVGLEMSTGANPRRIVVVTRVRLETTTTLLGMVGIRSLSSQAEGRARPYEGLNSTDAE